MMKRPLIALAAAFALTGAAAATATPASAMPTFVTPAYMATGFAAPSDVIQVHGGKKWKRQGHKHHGYKGHGYKQHGYKHRRYRKACTPIVRWQKVGYRYHRRWQQVVVGWDCHRGRRHDRWGWNMHWR